MGNGLTYPSVEKIEEYNLLALALIKVKKADSHKVLSSHKIQIAMGNPRLQRKMFMQRQLSLSVPWSAPTLLQAATAGLHS